MNTIVSVSGFGWSGSGAVIDFLSEYDDIEVLKYDKGDTTEISIICEKDGIYDLDAYLNSRCCRFQSSEAISAFRDLVDFHVKKRGYESIFNGKYKELSEKYLNSLIEYSFEGWTFWDQRFPSTVSKHKNRYNFFVEHLLRNRITSHLPFTLALKQKLSLNVSHVIEVAYQPDSFMEKTTDYLNNLFEEARSKKDMPLVIDQFYPADRPLPFMKYLPDSKVIVVRRDPRDSYLLAKCALDYMKVPLPIDNVDNFILYYKKIVAGSIQNNSDKLLSIQFEDLIYKYEETAKIIEDFLGINKHVRIKEAFNPGISINNTQLMERYPQYEKDIKKITTELKPFLYNYENCQYQRTTSKVF